MALALIVVASVSDNVTAAPPLEARRLAVTVMQVPLSTAMAVVRLPCTRLPVMLILRLSRSIRMPVRGDPETRLPLMVTSDAPAVTRMACGPVRPESRLLATTLACACDIKIAVPAEPIMLFLINLAPVVPSNPNPDTSESVLFVSVEVRRGGDRPLFTIAIPPNTAA